MVIALAEVSILIIAIGIGVGKLTLNYALTQNSDISVNVWDATGRSIYSQSLGNRGEGKNESELDLEGVPDGVYLVRVKTSSGDRVIKVMIRK